MHLRHRAEFRRPLSRRGNRGTVAADRAGGLRRVLEGRIEQHRPLRAALGASPRAPRSSSSARRSITSMAAARSRSASSPRRCRICRTGGCCSGSASPTRRLPPGTTASFDRPLRRAREYIEIVRKAAAGERVEYEGEIYNTGQALRAFLEAQSHPQFPIYLAGLGPQMTKLVGKISDGVFINMGTPETIQVRSPAASAPAPSKRAAIPTASRSSPRCACRSIRTAPWRARSCARC